MPCSRPNLKQKDINKQEDRSKTRVETALYSYISYAIDNNLIPIFGLDDIMTPVVVHNKIECGDLVTHTAASTLLANSIDIYIPKTKA